VHDDVGAEIAKVCAASLRKRREVRRRQRLCGPCIIEPVCKSGRSTEVQPELIAISAAVNGVLPVIGRNTVDSAHNSGYAAGYQFNKVRPRMAMTTRMGYDTYSNPELLCRDPLSLTNRLPNRMSALAILLVAASLYCRAPAAVAQAEAPESKTAEESDVGQAEEPESSAATLAEEFNDPLTTLPQISFQDVYTPSNYGTDAQTNRVTIRPIIPRIPKFSLLPFVQLIRPSFSVVTVPTGTGSETRTEFGDIQLFDLVLIPWPSRESGLLMGVGPLFIFPTATHRTAGQNAWQAGPAFAAIYRGIPGLLLGCLIQNPISFAYTSDTHQPLSTLLFQPILLKQIWKGLYVKSADSTWAFGWRDDAAKLLPLGIGLGYIIAPKGSTSFNFSVGGEWMAYRENAPIAPQTTVRFGISMGFPQLRPW